MSIKYLKHETYPEDILVRQFTGIVEVDDIIDSWNTLLKENQLTENVKGVINDISTCELVMKMDSFQTLITYLKQNEVFHRIKLAVICDDPKKIIFPLIGENRETELMIKPFTTHKSAENWILTD